jgi:hypothetical protein
MTTPTPPAGPSPAALATARQIAHFHKGCQNVADAGALILDIALALDAARREGAAGEREECARALCLHCAEGDTPGDYGEPFNCCHMRVSRNGFPTYTKCGAAVIHARAIDTIGE